MCTTVFVCLFICFLYFKNCSNTGLCTGCGLVCWPHPRGFPFHKILSLYIQYALPVDA